MNDLRAAAIEAVEKATADTELVGSVKIKAAKFLRDATGGYLRDIIPAVEWAMARPRPTLTRADKERAVAEMTRRVARAAESVAYAAVGFLAEDRQPLVDVFLRAQRRREAALLRLAMARTVD